MGATVIGIGRSRERCDEAARLIREQAGGQQVRFLLADLSSQAEIRRLAQEVMQTTTRLDVLLNNAGGIYLQRQLTDDAIEMTFAVNHLAYFLLTHLLVDLLRHSAPARVISVASAAHQGCSLDLEDLQGGRGRYHPWLSYRRSKLADILFARGLGRRLEGTGVTSNALHPGYVRTQIFRADGPLGWVLRRSAELFAVTPEEGARTSLYLAASPEVANVSGEYFVKCKALSGSPQSHDWGTAWGLWAKSEQFTGLSG